MLTATTNVKKARRRAQSWIPRKRTGDEFGKRGKTRMVLVHTGYGSTSKQHTGTYTVLLKLDGRNEECSTRLLYSVELL